MPRRLCRLLVGGVALEDYMTLLGNIGDEGMTRSSASAPRPQWYARPRMKGYSGRPGGSRGNAGGQNSCRSPPYSDRLSKGRGTFLKLVSRMSRCCTRAPTVEHVILLRIHLQVPSSLRRCTPSRFLVDCCVLCRVIRNPMSRGVRSRSVIVGSNHVATAATVPQLCALR